MNMAWGGVGPKRFNCTCTHTSCYATNTCCHIHHATLQTSCYAMDAMWKLSKQPTIIGRRASVAALTPNSLKGCGSSSGVGKMVIRKTWCQSLVALWASNRLKKWEAEKRRALKTCPTKTHSMLQYVTMGLQNLRDFQIYHEMTTALWRPANLLLARLPLRMFWNRTLQRQNLSQVLPNPPIRPRQVHVRIPGHCKS